MHHQTTTSMDNIPQHNHLVDQLTDKLTTEIKEKHLVSLIAEYEPSTFKKQYHVNVDKKSLSPTTLKLLSEKNYNCVFNTIINHPEYKKLETIEYFIRRNEPFREFANEVSMLTHEYNNTVIKLFITPQLSFFNNFTSTKQDILRSLSRYELYDTVSKLISMENQSVIRYFFSTSYISCDYTLLRLLCYKQQNKIIEQIIALEHNDISHYFEDLFEKLDDKNLCVKILTNHIHHTP